MKSAGADFIRSVEKIASCHCSGDHTRKLFKQEYGADYIDSSVGKRVPLPKFQH